MASLSQSVLSTEPVQVQVRASLNGAAYNPTGDAVAMAFVPLTNPATSPTSGQWNPATWESDPGGNYWASILVGPLNGGVSLAAGTYQIWAKVTDNPAVPVQPAGILVIF